MDELKKMQAEINEWTLKNFGEETPEHITLGVCEEAGELCHAVLKRAQGIRGTASEHTDGMRDAIGDIAIYPMHLSSVEGWDFWEILQDTWARVGSRDWTKNKEDGGGVE